MTASQPVGMARTFPLVGRAATWQVALVVLLAMVAASRWILPSYTGLRIEHFSNSARMGAPVLEGISPEVSIDQLIKTWNGEPPRAYSARWSGYLIVRREGAYVFSLTSDDGSTLHIDGALVIDNSGSHASRTVTGRIVLDRGPHAVVVEYDQNDGDAALEWLWGPEGSTLEPVAPTALSPHRLGPTTMWVIDALEAASVPAMAAAGVVVVWVAFPPASRLGPTRRRDAANGLDA